MSEGLSVLAVDDEQPALADLARLLRGLPSVGEVDVATSGSAALGKLSARTYDAVFLDVRMPELDGVELTRILRRFEQRPAVVFVSAYADAAVDAFELRAVDYLMKPVSRQRLAETLAHVGQVLATRTDAQRERTAGHDVVPAQNARGSTRLVPRSSILYIESSGDYVRLVCDDGRYLMRGHISDFETRWRSAGFVRVHRQYVASIGRAVELQPQLNGTALLVFPEGISIPVSRRHVPLLMKELER